MTILGLILLLIGTLLFAYRPLAMIRHRLRWIRYVAAFGLWTPTAAPARLHEPPTMVRAIAEIAEIYDRA